MRPALGVLLLFGSILTFLFACSPIQLRDLSTGEMVLTGIELPDIMARNMPYDAIVKFEADGDPKIRKVCFRWFADTPSVAHSSIYWYTHEVQTDEETGSAKARWIEQGPYTDMSNAFCLDSGSINHNNPNRLIVRFKSDDLKPQYNRLACYAEYVHDGEVKRTNEVSTRFVVDR
ncbi:MAG: hypothetical protein AB2L11_06455 [Syntrophobacteraceae bacterium]